MILKYLTYNIAADESKISDDAMLTNAADSPSSVFYLTNKYPCQEPDHKLYI